MVEQLTVSCYAVCECNLRSEAFVMPFNIKLRNVSRFFRATCTAYYRSQRLVDCLFLEEDTIHGSKTSSYATLAVSLLLY